MTAHGYARLAAMVFALIAGLQLTRAILGWSATVDMGSGPMAMPVWPSWIAFAVFAILAWLGFTASRAPVR